MKGRKKKWKRGVGILLTLVLLCGILQGGRILPSVAAQVDEGGEAGDSVPEGSKVEFYNNFAGEHYYATSLEDAFGNMEEVTGSSGEIHIKLLADVVLQQSITVDSQGAIIYLELNGYTIVSEIADAAFQVTSGPSTFQISGLGAIYTTGTAFQVSGSELSLAGNVYVYTQGDTGIQVTGGTAKLLGGYVSAEKTALRVEGSGNVMLSMGALRTVSGSAIDASGSTIDASEKPLLESFLQSYDDEKCYKGEDGQPIVLEEGQKVIAGYCSVGSGAGFAPEVNIKFSGDTSFVYNGQAWEPPVQVSVQGIPMRPEDYSVSYSGNLNAGTATIGISCKGIFAPATATKTFEISPAVPQLTWGQEEVSKVYNGQPVVLEQELVVELVNGESFTEKFSGSVQYSYRAEGEDADMPGLPTNAGTYQVKAKVPAEGNYAEGETQEELRLVIKKTPIPSPAPAESMNVAYSHETLKTVELPEGWAWQDVAVPLEVGSQVEGVAVYQGEDRENYETVNVKVMVTRGEPTPTPSPEPTQEPVSPTPDATPSPEPTPEPVSPTPDVTPSPEPTQEPSRPMPDNTPSPEPTREPASPTPDATPSPEPTDEPTSPTPDATPSPEPTQEPVSPTPDATPSPEPTQEPVSPTPEPTPIVKDTDEPKHGEPLIRIDGEGNIKKGWDAILEEVDKAEDGSKITVDMNGAVVVPKDVLESIRDKDVTIVLDLGNGISWSISGKDITADELGDIDFEVQMGSNTIPVDVINMITGQRYTIQVSLAYDGEFGLTATLTVELGSENAGYNASLYYYNPEIEALEYITMVQIQEDGTASWKFTHASDYVIVVWEEEQTDVPEDKSGEPDDLEPELPDTGMAWKASWFFLIGMLFVFAGFGMVFLEKKRQDAKR